MNFDGDVYTQLKRNRVRAVVNYFGSDWFKGKKILEIGCGHADMGNVFFLLGADVMVSDAREENLKMVKTKYYYLKTILFDLNKPNWPFDSDYDLILNMGVLYHLEEYETLLNNCFAHCNHMALETIVSDSDNLDFVSYVKESDTIDQSFTGVGCRPSWANIERLILKNNFSFIRNLDKDLDCLGNLFSWLPINDRLCYRSINKDSFFLRRFWFCTKGVVNV